jgi:hypothetical protein
LQEIRRTDRPHSSILQKLQICFDQEKSQGSEDLIEIRRRFQIVEISGKAARSLKKPLRPSVLEYLKTIGTDILKIKLHNLTFNKAVILELMKTMQKIEKLEINGLTNGLTIGYKEF